MTGKKVKNHTLTRRHFKSGTLLKGNTGAQGPAGQQGPPGPQGERGAPGAAGSALAFARINQNGTLDPGNSKNVSLLGRSSGSPAGAWCLQVTTAQAPRNVVASIDGQFSPQTDHAAGMLDPGIARPSARPGPLQSLSRPTAAGPSSIGRSSSSSTNRAGLSSARRRPVATAAGLVLLACSCGSGSSGDVARPQIAKLNWHENCGTRADRIPISTRRLVVEKGVWRVALSFRNETDLTLFIVRPHFPHDTYFGLEPFRTSSRREVIERAQTGAGAKPRTIAEHFRPPLPRLLPPGRGWSGEFSGRAALPAGVPIRVVLGRFVAGPPAP